MAETKHLDELFRVAERFRRSVNLALDYKDIAGLDGYVITPLSASVLSRIASGLGPSSKNRSWSITGPYGAGKSACMLFLAQMLGYPPRRAIRAIVEKDQPELYRQALAIPGWEQGGFVIIPMVCSRQPLSHTLLSGLLDTLSSVPSPSLSLVQHITDLQTIYGRAQQGEVISSIEITKAVEKTAGLLQAQEPSLLGIIIVLDELGKSLEYAALNPERGDIELLQILAEMASRSSNPVIGILTVLHQAFEHYASSLSPVQRREWNKVQGRFEDVGFFQSTGELLGLVSRSIKPPGDNASLKLMIAAEAHRAEALEILPRDLGKEQALLIVAGCAPLHPTAALALGPLFRSRLAQNERSLFAFLCSGEPHGFQEFLHAEKWSDNGYRPFYRLNQLYDYVLSALGSGLYTQSQGKHWAEIAEALERLPKDASTLDADLIKTIGMLGLLGDQRYLRASKSILIYALTDGHTTAQDIEESLNRLGTWKIAIHQRFKDAYGLWQGSDVDLDACFERGASQVDHSASLAKLLQQKGYLKPYVAKRHLHATGTLRFLIPLVTDLETLDQARDENIGDADGVVVFVLLPPGMHLEELSSEVSRYSVELHSPLQEQTLYAIPRHTQGIREALEEVMIWDWVTENTPELEGDSVARRELSARHLSARTRLERAISRCFDLSSSYTSCIWVWQGKVRYFSSARMLSSFVSDICDQVYSQAPIIKNELINRRLLSSAASGARRALIERMLIHGHEENLGLEGYPPEMSIYLSMFMASGLHRVAAQKWAFGPPDVAADPCHIQPLWRAVDNFLVETENGRRPVTELFDLLKRPPFGIKEGPLPIYLAAVMLYGQAEIALHEEGTFVPQVRIAEFERLLRAPQRFTLQHYRLTDTRARLLSGYIRLFNPKPEPSQVTMLSAVRALMGFSAQLPRYTQLTEELSEDARAIRKTLTSAREPQPLLFEALPAALGFNANDTDHQRTDAYMVRFKQALLELQHAYDRLLASIERELLDALHLPVSVPTARQEIAQQVSILGDWISDLNLRAFTLRLSDGQLTEREWLESVAALVVSKPPSSWNDMEFGKYRLKLSQLSEQLQRVEEMALSKGTTPIKGRLVRIGIMDDTGQEQRDVLHIMPEQELEIAKVVNALESTLTNLAVDKQLKLSVVAELAKRLLNDKTPEDEHHDR